MLSSFTNSVPSVFCGSSGVVEAQFVVVLLVRAGGEVGELGRLHLERCERVAGGVGPGALGFAARLDLERAQREDVAEVELLVCGNVIALRRGMLAVIVNHLAEVIDNDEGRVQRRVVRVAGKDENRVAVGIDAVDLGEQVLLFDFEIRAVDLALQRGRALGEFREAVVVGVGGGAQMPSTPGVRMPRPSLPSCPAPP